MTIFFPISTIEFEKRSTGVRKLTNQNSSFKSVNFDQLDSTLVYGVSAEVISKFIFRDFY